MKYGKVVTGEFVSRPNRFIAYVNVDGKTETVHVKNTGRCRELLVPKCKVYLEVSSNPSRKTKYDLIAVEKKRETLSPLLINMDSQSPNAVAEEWLKKGGLFSKSAVIRREVTHGGSRFDFYIEDGERRAFLEVKGVTLEENGVALFPDAPTERGIKHIHELMDCVKQGYEAYLLFVVQMKGVYVVRPNDKTHKAFGDALRLAVNSGVKVLAVDCVVTADTLTVGENVKTEM